MSNPIHLTSSASILNLSPEKVTNPGRSFHFRLLEQRVCNSVKVDLPPKSDRLELRLAEGSGDSVKLSYFTFAFTPNC